MFFFRSCVIAFLNSVHSPLISREKQGAVRFASSELSSGLFLSNFRYSNCRRYKVCSVALWLRFPETNTLRFNARYVSLPANVRASNIDSSANQLAMPCDEQDELARIVLQGASLYLGGKAGTGKSFFLRRIIKELQAKGLRVAVTGSTGVAALNVGGSTFHSFFGISVDSAAPSHRKRGSFSSQASFPSSSSSSNTFQLSLKKNVFHQFDVIVIDEISFLHAGYLELLEQSAREARGRENKNKPFGGLQMIVSGDFLQLTAIESTKENQILCSGVEKKQESKNEVLGKMDKSFNKKRKSIAYYRDLPMFESFSFQNYLLHLEFVQIRRQKDAVFAEALNKLRLGELPTLIARSAVLNKERKKAVRLFATKSAVREYNSLKMMKLSGKEYYFPSELAVNRMSADSSNSGNRFLSDVLIIFVLKRKKNCSKTRRITFSEGDALIQQLCTALKLPKSAITWCILPERGSHAGLSRIAIRFVDYSPKKCLLYLTMAIAWVSTKIKAHKSILTLQVRTQGKPLSGGFAPFDSLLLFRFSVRTIQQFISIVKNTIGPQFKFNLQNDYALCGKRLKVGCRVMLLKNINDIYVNGSLGEVVGFVLAKKAQKKLPLQMRPAAFTTYGSRHQMLVEDVNMEVLAEKKKSILSLKEKNKNNLDISERNTTPLKESGEDGYIPLVRMDVNGKVIAIPYLQIPLPNPSQAEGFYSISIICMPLTPAYAFTVHKVQGLTFHHPILFDAGDLFPCDHIVYVAASRVSRLEYLRIINLSPRMISVHRPSLQFALSLSAVSTAIQIWQDFLSDRNQQKSATCTHRIYLPTWAEKKEPQKTREKLNS